MIPAWLDLYWPYLLVACMATFAGLVVTATKLALARRHSGRTWRSR